MMKGKTSKISRTGSPIHSYTSRELYYTHFSTGFILFTKAFTYLHNNNIWLAVYWLTDSLKLLKENSSPLIRWDVQFEL